MTGIEVSIIKNVPGLPYREPYEPWEAHVEACGVCKSAMAAAALIGVGRMPGGLCDTGAVLDDRLADAIHAQHHSAEMN